MIKLLKASKYKGLRVCLSFIPWVYEKERMMKIDERQKTINAFFVDCWNFFKEFHFTAEEWEKAKDEKRWDRCTARAKELVEQYGKESASIIFDTMELIENSEREALKGISQYKLDPPIYR